MNNKYLQYIALLDLKTYHYKILLLLIDKAYNQAQISKQLNIKKQNIHKYFKELELLYLIRVERTEGKNKFYRTNLDIEKIKNHIPGQLQFKI
jgi:predicted transcriptional regulator